MHQKPTQKNVVTVQRLGRGWTAVHMWFNDRPEEFGPGLINEGFWEPWDTDIFSFATEEEAIIRAREYASELNIPLHLKEE